VLLTAQADPKFKAKDGATAFSIAVGRGNEALARLMMEHGADVNARDANGGTALHEAVRQGEIEWGKELGADGADLNARTEAPARGRGPAGGGFRFRNRTGMTAFLAAAETGDVAMMQELIKLGADAKTKTPDGTTALVLAAGSKKLDAVKF